MPSTILRRIGAGAIVLVITVLGFWGIAGILSVTAALIVWLLLRKRKGLSYLMVIPAVLLGEFGLQYLGYAMYWSRVPFPELAFGLVTATIVAGLAWAARGIHSRRASILAQRQQAIAAQQSLQLGGYPQTGYPQTGYPQTGYPAQTYAPAYVHPGGPVVARPGAPTNTVAVLALVFGVGGGLLGIILGHVARGQIRRSGEAGWGLATAGMVLGYIGLSVGVVATIAYIVYIAVSLR